MNSAYWNGFLSAAHMFAMAIGLSSILFRGRAMRATLVDQSQLPRVFAADNAWGLAAFLWISTGVARLYAEKGIPFYMHSRLFLVKLTLFLIIFALELYPMITLIRWRIADRQKKPINLAPLKTLARISHAELALTICIPFIAAMAVRGIGF